MGSQTMDVPVRSEDVRDAPLDEGIDIRNPSSGHRLL